jgi:hypothetical protein
MDAFEASATGGVPVVSPPLSEDDEVEVMVEDDDVAVVSRTVSIGQPLPTLDNDSKLPIRAQSLRQVVVTIEESMLPPPYRAHGADAWKNSAAVLSMLKSILPTGKKGKASRQIPYSLILDTKDMNELLVVINYWLHLTPDSKQRFYDSTLKTVYERPMTSNDRMKGPDEVVGPCDNHKRLAENAEKSHASNVVKTNKKHRTLESEVTAAGHLTAKPIRLKLKCLEDHIQDLMKMTVHSLSRFFEVCFVLKRDVGIPNKAGKTANLDLCLPHYKTLVVARNESTLRIIVGDSYVDSLKEDEHATMWYYDDHQDQTYSQYLKAQREADKIRNAQQTREETEHSESTLSPEDF